MYAIIEDSGTQIKVQPGDVIDIDPRPMDEGAETLTFDRVLLVREDGEDGKATIGRPYVDGATVAAEVIGERKDRKIDVIRFKRRKGHRTKRGHRQPYLRVRVSEINA